MNQQLRELQTAAANLRTALIKEEGRTMQRETSALLVMVVDRLADHIIDLNNKGVVGYSPDDMKKRENEVFETFFLKLLASLGVDPGSIDSAEFRINIGESLEDMCAYSVIDALRAADVMDDSGNISRFKVEDKLDGHQEDQ